MSRDCASARRGSGDSPAMRDWGSVRSPRPTWGTGNGVDGRLPVREAVGQMCADVGRMTRDLIRHVIGGFVESTSVPSKCCGQMFRPLGMLYSQRGKVNDTIAELIVPMMMPGTHHSCRRVATHSGFERSSRVGRCSLGRTGIYPITNSRVRLRRLNFPSARSSLKALALPK
jgi:hypothetical protein